jgi:hypothetical protein
MDRDRLDVQAGIMSVPEYREKWYGEDEKTANEKYNEHFLYKIVENYQAALTSGAMTPTQYVEKVFPYAQNKDEIIDYISSFVGRQEATMSDFLYDGNEQGLEENVEEELDEEDEKIEEYDEDEEEIEEI